VAYERVDPNQGIAEYNAYFALIVQQKSTPAKSSAHFGVTMAYDNDKTFTLVHDT